MSDSRKFSYIVISINLPLLTDHWSWLALHRAKVQLYLYCSATETFSQPGGISKPQFIQRLGRALTKNGSWASLRPQVAAKVSNSTWEEKCTYFSSNSEVNGWQHMWSQGSLHVFPSSTCLLVRKKPTPHYNKNGYKAGPWEEMIRKGISCWRGTVIALSISSATSMSKENKKIKAAVLLLAKTLCAQWRHTNIIQSMQLIPTITALKIMFNVTDGGKKASALIPNINVHFSALQTDVDKLSIIITFTNWLL